MRIVFFFIKNKIFIKEKDELEKQVHVLRAQIVEKRLYNKRNFK